MHEGRVCDPAELRHVHSVHSCTHVASNMDEVSVEERFGPPSQLLRYTDRVCRRKSRALCLETTRDLRLRIHPREVHDSLAKFLTNTTKRIRLIHRQKSEKAFPDRVCAVENRNNRVVTIATSERDFIEGMIKARKKLV